MKKLSAEEVKKVQLEILDVVAEFCKKNDINYWLDSGTLLGAVRHGGYIPWDDDIDIGMLRPDYEKFRKMFNDSNTRYKFNCIENDMSFLYPFGKVMDTTTYLREAGEFELSVNIDVFCYDNAPDDDKAAKRIFKRRDNLRKLFSLRNNKARPSGNLIRRIVVRIARVIIKPVSKGRIIQAIATNARRYEKFDTKRIGNFLGYNPVLCEADVFKDFELVEFEGKEYYAPVKRHIWLETLYGDYMVLPPEEKRITHHSYEAYKK